MNQQQLPAEFKGRLHKGKDWRELVAWVGDLPPMPHVASRALQLLEDPDVSADELAALLATDTALAARVLKIANSAMFCRQREICTLKQAIVVIGLKSLKGIIAAATLRQTCKEFTPLRTLVWEHSVCTALCATAIGRSLKKRFVDELFLLGLLHSLGQIVLLNQEETSAEYNRVMADIENTSCTYTVVEEEILGFSHTLIGALVAKKWNFSPDTCQTILHYRDPIDSKPELEQDQKTAIVQLADLMVHELGIGSPANYPRAKDEIHRLALLVDFDSKKVTLKLDELTHQVAQQFENEKRLFE
jgi:HD-like signal output (HDOD) protein